MSPLSGATTIQSTTRLPAQCNVEHLDVPKRCHVNPALFQQFCTRLASTNDDDEREGDALFVPDATDYRATLGNGAETRILFQRVGRRLVPQFRVPNRDSPIPAGLRGSTGDSILQLASFNQAI